MAPRYFPVNLGRSWTYRTVSRQTVDGSLVEDVTIERERIDGVIPMSEPVAGASWVVSLSHDITLADKTREHFATQLYLSEAQVLEGEGNPFISTTASQWETVSADGLTTYSYQSTEGVSVEVMAGLFTDTMLVTEQALRDGQVVFTRKSWYAAGVGRVKSEFVQVSGLGEYTELRELATYVDE
jgi:hypothetical protein